MAEVGTAPQQASPLLDEGVRTAIDAVMHLIGQPADVIAEAIGKELGRQGRIVSAEFVNRLARVFAPPELVLESRGGAASGPRRLGVA